MIYRVVQVTDYKLDNLFLFVSGSSPLPSAPGSRSSVLYLYPIAYVLCKHVREWEGLW